MMNNDFNNKVLDNVREKIAVSNLEREYNMKMQSKRKVISISMAVILVLLGGFVAVDAASNGEISEKIVNNVQEYLYIKEDGNEEELDKHIYIYTDENGKFIVSEDPLMDTDTPSDTAGDGTTVEGQNNTTDANDIND